MLPCGKVRDGLPASPPEMVLAPPRLLRPILCRMRQRLLVIEHAGVVEHVEISAACGTPEKALCLSERLATGLTPLDLAAPDWW
jgi:hypothetical protein